MAVFPETGIQKRKEEEARSAARCHGIAALPGGRHTCFQKGREPGVDGDLPGREHLPGTEGKLELTDRNTDRQANKAFTQLCISTGTILGLGYVTWGEDLTFNQGPESRKEHLEGLINDLCKEQICCLRPKHQDTM